MDGEDSFVPPLVFDAFMISVSACWKIPTKFLMSDSGGPSGDEFLPFFFSFCLFPTLFLQCDFFVIAVAFGFAHLYQPRSLMFSVTPIEIFFEAHWPEHSERL